MFEEGKVKASESPLESCSEAVNSSLPRRETYFGTNEYCRRFHVIDENHITTERTQFMEPHSLLELDEKPIDPWEKHI